MSFSITPKGSLSKSLEATICKYELSQDSVDLFPKMSCVLGDTSGRISAWTANTFTWDISVASEYVTHQSQSSYFEDSMSCTGRQYESG